MDLKAVFLTDPTPSPLSLACFVCAPDAVEVLCC
jgi:hypothetical protein